MGNYRSKKAYLVVAHPGHELLLHGWLEECRPQIMVLTDGSGRTGTPRISATKDYIESLGLKYGPLFGRFTDQTIYAKILRQDFGFFHSLAEEVCQTLISENVELVVADSAEGYNSVHDICRMIVDSAVGLAGRNIDNYEYPVVGSLKGRAASNRNYRASTLNEAVVARKIAAAFTHFPELLNQIQREFPVFTDLANTQTASPLSTEYLRERSLESGYSFTGKPFYEQWGGEQVAKGNYQETIRYADHMLPIANALRQLEYAEGELIALNANARF
jgi:hypothetical protein